MVGKKRRRIKRRSKPVEDYDEVEELEGEDVEDLDEVEEETPPNPKPKRTRRKARKVEEDPDEEEFDDEPEEVEEDPDEEELDDEPPPESAKKPAERKKATPPPAKKDDIEVKKVDDQIVEGVLTELLEAMDDGQSIVLTRLSAATWQFAGAQAALSIPSGPILRGKEFKAEVQTEEYKEWHEEWADLTYPEKKKYAKKLKVTWDEHEDQRVDNIRMSSAVRAKLNIEKYKPEYIEKGARDRLQGK